MPCDPFDRHPVFDVIPHRWIQITDHRSQDTDTDHRYRYRILCAHRYRSTDTVLHTEIRYETRLHRRYDRRYGIRSPISIPYHIRTSFGDLDLDRESESEISIDRICSGIEILERCGADRNRKFRSIEVVSRVGQLRGSTYIRRILYGVRNTSTSENGIVPNMARYGVLRRITRYVSRVYTA